MNTQITTVALALTFAACTGNAPSAPITTEPTHASLTLAPTPCGDHACVTLRFGAAAQRPRMAEVFVEHGGGLELIGAEPGPSAVDADKTVTASEVDGAVRVLIYASDNIEELASGDLALLRFRRLAAGDTTVRIRADRPFFAPAAAMRGIQLDDAFAL